MLCAGCVDHALESGETTPEKARAHTRQAILALCFGIGAWILSGGFLLLLALVAHSSDALMVGLLFLLVVIGNALLAAAGVGQALAALRTRGNHMILATAGLILNGLYLGVLVGLFSNPRGFLE
jgi:hypothetical protein